MWIRRGCSRPRCGRCAPALATDRRVGWPGGPGLLDGDSRGSGSVRFSLSGRRRCARWSPATICQVTTGLAGAIEHDAPPRMGSIKQIVLIAHDQRKADLVEWATY